MITDAEQADHAKNHLSKVINHLSAATEHLGFVAQHGDLAEKAADPRAHEHLARAGVEIGGAASQCSQGKKHLDSLIGRKGWDGDENYGKACAGVGEATHSLKMAGEHHAKLAQALGADDTDTAKQHHEALSQHIAFASAAAGRAKDALAAKLGKDVQKAAMKKDEFGLFAPFQKVDDEKRMVWGYASTPTKDLQGEIVTPEAIKKALPDYMEWHGGPPEGNLREMHQPSAVGTVPEATIDSKGLYIGAHVSDDEAWKKVCDGTYKGFSIGGKKLRKVGDTVHDVAMYEISLVDRPANPDCRIDCFKAAGLDESGLDTEMTEDERGLLFRMLAKVIGIKATDDRVAKREFSDAARDKAADSGAALPDGSFPIQNISDLHNAIQAHGRAKDPAKAKAHIISRAKALGATSALPEDWGKGYFYDHAETLNDATSLRLAAMIDDFKALKNDPDFAKNVMAERLGDLAEGMLDALQHNSEGTRMADMEKRYKAGHKEAFMKGVGYMDKSMSHGKKAMASLDKCMEMGKALSDLMAKDAEGKAKADEYVSHLSAAKDSMDTSMDHLDTASGAVKNGISMFGEGVSGAQDANKEPVDKKEAGATAEDLAKAAAEKATADAAAKAAADLAAKTADEKALDERIAKAVEAATKPLSDKLATVEKENADLKSLTKVAADTPAARLLAMHKDGAHKVVIGTDPDPDNADPMAGVDMAKCETDPRYAVETGAAVIGKMIFGNHGKSVMDSSFKGGAANKA